MLENSYYIIFAVTTTFAILVTATWFILNEGKNMLMHVYRYKAYINISKENCAGYLILSIMIGAISIIVGLLLYFSLFLNIKSTNQSVTSVPMEYYSYQLIYVYPIVLIIFIIIESVRFKKKIIKICEGKYHKKHYGIYIIILFVCSAIFLPVSYISTMYSQIYIERDSLQNRVYSIIINNTNLLDISSIKNKSESNNLLIKVNNDKLGYVKIGELYKQKNVKKLEIKTNDNKYGEINLDYKKGIKNGDTISIWQGNKEIGSNKIETFYYKYLFDIVPVLICLVIIDYILMLQAYSILNIYNEIQKLKYVKILYKNNQIKTGKIIFDTGNFTLIVDKENNYEYISTNEISKIIPEETDIIKQQKEREGIMSKSYKKVIKYKFYIIGLLIILIAIPFFVNLLLKQSNDSSWISFWGSYLGGLIGGIGTLIAVLLTTKVTRKVQEEDRNTQIANYKKKFTDEIASLVAKYITDIDAYFYSQILRDINEVPRSNRKVSVEIYYLLHIKLDEINIAKALLIQLDKVHNKYCFYENGNNEKILSQQTELLKKLTIEFIKNYRKES